MPELAIYEKRVDSQFQKYDGQIDILNKNHAQTKTRLSELTTKEDIEVVKSRVMALEKSTKQQGLQIAQFVTKQELITSLQQESMKTADKIQKLESICDRLDREVQSLDRRVVERSDPLFQEILQNQAILKEQLQSYKQDTERTRNDLLRKLSSIKNTTEGLKTSHDANARQSEGTSTVVRELESRTANFDAELARSKQVTHDNAARAEDMKLNQDRLTKRMHRMEKRMLKHESCCVIL